MCFYSPTWIEHSVSVTECENFANIASCEIGMSYEYILKVAKFLRAKGFSTSEYVHALSYISQTCTELSDFDLSNDLKKYNVLVGNQLVNKKLCLAVMLEIAHKMVNEDVAIGNMEMALAFKLEPYLFNRTERIICETLNWRLNLEPVEYYFWQGLLNQKDEEVKN